ncbi:MAG: glucose-6-phosphate isomerase, partial [Evtepia sp.]
DNTDPMGMDCLFDQLEHDLAHCLVVVISKSGSTIETRNGLIETKQFFADCGLEFAKQAVSISQADSILDRMAQREHWLSRFPMWDWVGGRTSVFSAVGLLPLALQGVDIAQLLEGAKACDIMTRKKEENPAACIACLWYSLVEEQGLRQMVLLPYKDSLGLLTQYCQQLIMESIGKKLDRQGNIVQKGFSVWGNKGSTDQHSFVQQLLEGENNFFTVFVQVWKEREKDAVLVGENSTGGDYLQAFLLGTEKALSEAGRQSVIISLPEVNAYYLGVLIALFERAVGLFASLLNVNAYDQPGVEHGKKCASEIIALKNDLLSYLEAHHNTDYTVSELQQQLQLEDQKVLLNLLLHLAANKGNHIESSDSEDLFNKTFRWVRLPDAPHQ